LKKFNIEHNFVVKNIYEYYAKWIREGKLKVNSDWNKDLKIKFTVQDPCQIVRKTFGEPIADDLRFVVKSVVGEENFIDMVPNRSNNYCCGGGGGFLQSGMKEERLPVVHMWTLICLSLGILGPNERVYLGEDLQDVLVFHPESAM
jgi:Fe-S oxidoreductase